jgi:hypothetical protein
MPEFREMALEDPTENRVRGEACVDDGVDLVGGKEAFLCRDIVQMEATTEERGLHPLQEQVPLEPNIAVDQDERSNSPYPAVQVCSQRLVAFPNV